MTSHTTREAIAVQAAQQNSFPTAPLRPLVVFHEPYRELRLCHDELILIFASFYLAFGHPV